MVEWNISAPTTEYYDHASPNLASVIQEVINTLTVSIDTETTGLNITGDYPLYWSLAWGNRRMTLNASILHHFAEAFNDPKKRWVFANAKYDTHILANVGIGIAGSLIDTQVMHALLYEERSHRLKDMAEHILNWRWADFEDTFGKIGKTQTPIARIKKAEAENFQLLAEYAANDAWGTLKVYEELKRQLRAAPTHSLFRTIPPFIETLDDLFEKVEIPYTKVLWKNERNGILVDRAYLEQIQPIAKKEIDDLNRAITKEAGYIINPSSPDQLQDYFFNKLGVKSLKMTKGGKSGVRKPSVDKGFLEYYANEIPMAKYLLEHRRLSKLYGTYIVGINELLDNQGRVHTQFHQDTVRTGRLSSSAPNLQNIVKGKKDKWKLRGAFIASKGNKLICADFQQLEMRLLACASLDQGMIDVINRGWDIHMGNASLIFNIPYEEIKEAKKIYKEVEEGNLPESAVTNRVMECLDARERAKTMGFALVYGQGEKATARQLGISIPEVKTIFRKFNEAMPAAERFGQEAIQETLETGYTFTILGRRRNVPQIASHRQDERASGERIAKNTQIQGSAADVVKMVQINLDKSGIDIRFDCHSILQVHDELIHECPEEVAEEAKKEIKEWMETPFCIELAVPLTIDIGIGNNWMEAKG